jgi:hypothetical protein
VYSAIGGLIWRPPRTRTTPWRPQQRGLQGDGDCGQNDPAFSRRSHPPCATWRGASWRRVLGGDPWTWCVLTVGIVAGTAIGQVTTVCSLYGKTAYCTSNDQGARIAEQQREQYETGPVLSDGHDTDQNLPPAEKEAGFFNCRARGNQETQRQECTMARSSSECP